VKGEDMRSRVLRTVPREKAFYFFTSIGNYTGESASSLKEFSDKINVVDVKALEFHLYRGDFEKWVSEVLEDEGLAMEIRNLREKKYTGSALKEQLYNIVAKHYKELATRYTFSF
jgi:hypothetical protein